MGALAPSSFYGDFPLGRGWIELLPAYSQHLATASARSSLATGALLLGAASGMERQTVVVEVAR